MKLNATIDCKQGAVRAVRYNVDGQYCLTSGANKTVKLWNPTKKVLLKTYSSHGNEVFDAKSSCDSSQIVSCGLDKTVIISDVTTGAVQRKWRGHAGVVNCVAFNEDSSVVVSGSIDCTACCWDTRSKSIEPIQRLEEPKDSVTTVQVSDHEIILGCADGKVYRYDIRGGQLLTDVVTQGGSVASVALTKDGQCLLIGSAQEPVKLFDKSNGQLLQEYVGVINKKGYRLEAVLGMDNKNVFSGSENGLVLVWDMVEGNLKETLKHGEENLTVHSLTFHPMLDQLCSAAKEMLYLWTNEDEST